MPDEITDILNERGANYGEFSDVAKLTLTVMAMLEEHGGIHRMTHSQQLAVAMIVQKLSRLLNGNTHHRDSWDDIAGYALLARDN